MRPFVTTNWYIFRWPTRPRSRQYFLQMLNRGSIQAISIIDSIIQQSIKKTQGNNGFQKYDPNNS